MASEVERFPPTNGRVSGIVGLVVVGVVLVASILDAGAEVAPWLVCGCLFAVVVIWVVLLRPAVRVEGTDLVLRGEVDTRRVPLAAVERVVVGPVLAVSVDGRRYTNTAIGRSRRQSRKDDREETVQGMSVGAFVESRIAALAEDARLRRVEPGAVRRAWAWPEITALVVTALATVVAILV